MQGQLLAAAVIDSDLDMSLIVGIRVIRVDHRGGIDPRQRKREGVRSSIQLDRRFKKEDKRVGGTTADLVTPKKSTVVRKKKRIEEVIGPRL